MYIVQNGPGEKGGRPFLLIRLLVSTHGTHLSDKQRALLTLIRPLTPSIRINQPLVQAKSDGE
jgi:hypothetical protein